MNERMPNVTHPDAVSESSYDSGGKRLSNVKRFAIAGGICLVVIGALAGLKFAQISALIRSGKAAHAAGPPPAAVGTRRPPPRNVLGSPCSRPSAASPPRAA